MPGTNTLVLGVFAAATAAGKVLDPADVFAGLYIDGPTPSPPVTVDDFTLPDATDVPAKAVTAWTDPFELIDGRWCIQSNLLTWRLPDADNAFAAGGFYLADALTGGNVLTWVAFGTPINFPDENSEYSLVVRLVLDPTGEWDASVSIV